MQKAAKFGEQQPRKELLNEDYPLPQLVKVP